MKTAGSESKLAGSHVMMLKVELFNSSGFDSRWWILPKASGGNDVGSSADGAVGSGSMVYRPFLSMILSAADPEPDSSSFSGLSAKVKMVDHWFVGLGCKSPIVF